MGRAIGSGEGGELGRAVGDVQASGANYPGAAMTFECGHPKTPENTAVLQGRYEYCRVCIRESANRRYRAKTGAKQKAFASLDAKLATLIMKGPEHWLWQGQMRDGSTAICAYERETVFVAQLLWERDHGPVPDKHCLYRTCSLSRCVRPRCRVADLRGSHISEEQMGLRWVADEDKPGKQIYGISPEAAAIFGLIDAEQYMAQYKREKRIDYGLLP